MRCLVSFAAIFLLLLTAAPVLACATDSSMTHEERACCRSMHGDCGEMAKTGCCRTELHTDAHPQLAASGPHLQLSVILVGWMLPAFTRLRAIDPAVFDSPDEHSPPGLLIARMTVLQI